jgi:eukaryotic-like serine/threonine-protein kinase
MKLKVVIMSLLVVFFLSLNAVPVSALDGQAGNTVFAVDLKNGKIDPKVVVSDDKIFAITEGSYNYTTFSYDAMPKVFCLDMSGNVIWSTTINGGGWQLAAPVVSNGMVIVPSTDGSVYSLNEANGSIEWTYNLPFSYTGVTSTPIIYQNLIILANGDGSIIALTVAGKMAWTVNIASSIYFSSPVAKDGMIYIGSEDNKLHAIHANGSGEAWNITLPGKVRATPLLLDDEIVVNYAVYSGFVATDGSVVAIGYNGSLLWSVNINSTSTSPVKTSNGILVTSVTGVWMISDAGSLLWHANIDVFKGSAAASDQGVYLVSYGTPSRAYLLDNNGNVLFNRTLSPEGYSMNTPTLNSGKVYIGSDNGYVYALNAAESKDTSMIYILGAFVAVIVVIAIVGMAWQRSKKRRA